jgi:hypothetical protein
MWRFQRHCIFPSQLNCLVAANRLNGFLSSEKFNVQKAVMLDFSRKSAKTPSCIFCHVREEDDDEATDATVNVHTGMARGFMRLIFPRCDQIFCTCLLEGAELVEVMLSMTPATVAPYLQLGFFTT